VVITGLSGSGKSTALRALEDLGYYGVDNLPIALLPSFLEIKSKEVYGPQKVALVMDIREEEFIARHREIFEQVRRAGHHLEILFFEASDEVLIARFSQTRRPHPLAPKGSLADAVRLERAMLQEVKEIADLVIDTSNLNVHQLRQEIKNRYAVRKNLAELLVHFISFGFKYGVPAEAHMVLDVRFLPNPYFVRELKPLSGEDPRVRDYVVSHEPTRQFINLCEQFLRFLVPQYNKEGKSYLVICIGCTGGRHRSVALAEELGQMVKEWGYEVLVTHRDVHKEA